MTLRELGAEMVRALYASGKSQAEIATTAGVCQAAVNQYMKRHSIKARTPGEGHLGRKNPLHSAWMKEHYWEIASPEGLEVARLSRIGSHHTAESKKRNSERHIGMALGEKNGFFGKHHSDEAKGRFSASIKARFVSDPTYRRRVSDGQAAYWASLSEEERQRKIAGLAKIGRPTSLEIELSKIVSRHNFPLRYVGDGSFWIGHKNPDFVCSDGRQLAVETAGRYWHTQGYERSRLAYFKACGWDGLIIWEEEFKNLESVVMRLNGFLK